MLKASTDVIYEVIKEINPSIANVALDNDKSRFNVVKQEIKYGNPRRGRVSFCL